MTSNPTQLKERKVNIKRYYGTSVIGHCITCGKEFGDYTNRREGYNHARSTGHKVLVEITNNFHYN